MGFLGCFVKGGFVAFRRVEYGDRASGKGHLVVGQGFGVVIGFRVCRFRVLSFMLLQYLEPVACMRVGGGDATAEPLAPQSPNLYHQKKVSEQEAQVINP